MGFEPCKLSYSRFFIWLFSFAYTLNNSGMGPEKSIHLQRSIPNNSENIHDLIEQQKNHLSCSGKNPYREIVSQLHQQSSSVRSFVEQMNRAKRFQIIEQHNQRTQFPCLPGSGFYRTQDKLSVTYSPLIPASLKKICDEELKEIPQAHKHPWYISLSFIKSDASVTQNPKYPHTIMLSFNPMSPLVYSESALRGMIAHEISHFLSADFYFSQFSGPCSSRIIYYREYNADQYLASRSIRQAENSLIHLEEIFNKTPFMRASLTYAKSNALSILTCLGLFASLSHIFPSSSIKLSDVFTVNCINQPLFFYLAFREYRESKKFQSTRSELNSTHPSLPKRIACMKTILELLKAEEEIVKKSCPN